MHIIISISIVAYITTTMAFFSYLQCSSGNSPTLHNIIALKSACNKLIDVS